MKTKINIDWLWEQVTQAPENNIVPLPIAIIQEQDWTKTDVAKIIEWLNSKPLAEFWENQRVTMQLWELFGLSSKKLWRWVLKDTLDILGVKEFQAANDEDYWAPDKTVMLWAMAA